MRACVQTEGVRHRRVDGTYLRGVLDALLDRLHDEEADIRAEANLHRVPAHADRAREGSQGGGRGEVRWALLLGMLRIRLCTYEFIKGKPLYFLALGSL